LETKNELFGSPFLNEMRLILFESKTVPKIELKTFLLKGKNCNRSLDIVILLKPFVSFSESEQSMKVRELICNQYTPGSQIENILKLS